MNDLRIKPFDFNQAVARAGLRPDGLPRTDAVAGGFQAAMADALKGVSQTQFEASRLQREYPAVHWRGLVPRSELPYIYSAADVFTSRAAARPSVW